ncbi:MAG: phosphate ABC transporter substrate-binding protein [Bacteroidales bacterium]|nr:phosphate ABC transporter substrate-binding protein [Bacteroidales bacterium]
MKKNRFLTIMLSMILVLSATGFSQSKITVKGSDTMVILAQKWAELYMKSNPSTVIQVTGGGSGVGITALINGTTDICNASRPMKQTEIEKLKARYNTLGVQIPCAKDGITIFLNEANKVQELSIKQLSDIYQGKIRNWKELGGNDAEIRLYGRENSSGTYTYFHDEVVNGDYAASVQTLPGTAAVVNAVKKDVNGIGYGGAAYAQGVKHAKVKKDDKSPAILPTPESIGKGEYPITRFLYMYLRNRPTGDTKKYVDWILSAEGQMIVTEVGYFPYK